SCAGALFGGVAGSVCVGGGGAGGAAHLAARGGGRGAEVVGDGDPRQEIHLGVDGAVGPVVDDQRQAALVGGAIADDAEVIGALARRERIEEDHVAGEEALAFGQRDKVPHEPRQ